MNLNKFTIKSQEAIQKAQEIAGSNNSQAIEPIHILKGILSVDENVIPFILKKLDVNFPVFLQAVDNIILSLPKVSGGDQYLSNEANEVLQKAQSHLNPEYALENLFQATITAKYTTTLDFEASP